MAWDFLLYLLYLLYLFLPLFLLLRILLLLQKFPVHSDLQLKGEPPGTGIRPRFHIDTADLWPHLYRTYRVHPAAKAHQQEL